MLLLKKGGGMPGKKKLTDNKTKYIWASLRIILGIVFLWAFLDKMFGFGFSTCKSTNTVTKAVTTTVLCEKAVLSGGSATTGFLKFGTKGPLKDFYVNLAGNPLVDFLFLAGLCLIGLALITGVGVKIAAISGIVMMLMMYSALFPPENNPLIDEHIVYALVLFGIFKSADSPIWGLGQIWQKQNIVKKYPILT